MRTIAGDASLQLVDPRRKRVDGRAAVQRAHLQLVAPRLSRLQEHELATLLGVEPPRVTIRSRLHGHAVSPLSEHPPHCVEAELVLAVELISAQPGGAADDRDRDATVGLRDGVVLVALLWKTFVRTRDVAVVARRILRDR